MKSTWGAKLLTRTPKTPCLDDERWNWRNCASCALALALPREQRCPSLAAQRLHIGAEWQRPALVFWRCQGVAKPGPGLPGDGVTASAPGGVARVDKAPVVRAAEVIRGEDEQGRRLPEGLTTAPRERGSCQAVARIVGVRVIACVANAPAFPAHRVRAAHHLLTQCLVALVPVVHAGDVRGELEGLHNDLGDSVVCRGLESHSVPHPWSALADVLEALNDLVGLTLPQQVIPDISEQPREELRQGTGHEQQREDHGSANETQRSTHEKD